MLPSLLPMYSILNDTNHLTHPVIQNLSFKPNINLQISSNLTPKLHNYYARFCFSYEDTMNNLKNF